MKKIFNIIAVAALVAAASCERVAEFKTYPFAKLDVEGSSIAVKEDAGKISVPVSVYNTNGSSCTVAFEIADVALKGKAITNADSYFTVSPAGGVLAFDGDGTKNIEINVINKPGVVTGNVTFKINIVSAEGATLGAPRNLSVAINDNDIPVDWDFIAGTWDAEDYDGSTYKVEIAKVDDSHFKLTNLWDGGQTIDGSITFDAAANTAALVIDGFQVIYVHSNYGPVGIFGLTADGNLDAANGYAALGVANAGGITIGPWIALILTGDYAYYSFDDGGVTKLTK